MRLLIDAHVFDGAFQGTRTYIEGLYSHMTHYRDIDFYFAAQDINNLRNVFGIAENIHYVQLSSSNKWKRLSIDFPRIIEDNNIDYAHFQYISPLIKKCKEIVTLHDLLFMDYPQFFTLLYRLPKRILFERSAKKSDILLTVSEYSKNSIARHFGIDKKKIFITYNSVLPSNDVCNKIGIKNKYGFGKFILTVSRIEPRKNHLALLKAYNELKLWSKGYHLVMVGVKDLQYQELFAYLDKLDTIIKEKVHMIQVPFEDLVALYKEASLFVFPSYGEGFGIPPLEAIAYGCPILCSNATAMAEFELPEQISFSPDNIEELKLKMMNQLEKPLSNSLYYERILAKYDWHNISECFYKLLKNCDPKVCY